MPYCDTEYVFTVFYIILYLRILSVILHITGNCDEVMCLIFCENGNKKDSNGCDICECEPSESEGMFNRVRRKTLFSLYHFEISGHLLLGMDYLHRKASVRSENV